MTIQFNSISSTQRKPAVLAEIDSSGASGLSKAPAKILLVGQMSPHRYSHSKHGNVCYHFPRTGRESFRGRFHASQDDPCRPVL